MELIERAVAALAAGELVVLPTDTVYGLVATAAGEEPAGRLYRVKGRPAGMPAALAAFDVDALLEAVPELRGRPESIARALLPGPYTLVLPNPARRFPWLAGESPETIGVRVPELAGAAREIVRRAGAVVATSANLHGGPEARRVGELAPELVAACAVVVDGGELPGTPSTVLDFTGPEPRVLREGAGPAGDALDRARAALA